MGNGREGQISGLNGASDQILKQMADFGASLEEPRPVLIEAAKGVAALGTTAGINKNLYAQDLQRYSRWLNESEATNLANQGLFAHGLITKGLSFTGSIVDGVTGVGKMLKEFSREYRAGDTSYKATMLSAFSTTLQLSAGYAVGTIAAGAVAGVTTVAAVPVIMAGCAAVGTSWLIGKMLDW